MKSLFSTARSRQLRKTEEGQTLVLGSVALVVLVLMAAIGVDAGYVYYQKQQMQKAADAGALAAAAALGYQGNYVEAARHDTSANGFTHGIDGMTVTVNNPPLTEGDPFYGDSNYVEVIVAQARPTFFMKIADLYSVNVRSRAVATSVGDASGCIYCLDPNSSGTLLVDGNVNLTASCSIYVNSSSPTALVKNGASGSVVVNAAGYGIGVRGGYSGTGFQPTPVTGIPWFSDPLAGVPAPSYSSCNYTNTDITSGTLPQGTYCGGIKIHGNGAVIFSGGLYILLGGGLTVTGTHALIGNGVTFYNTGDNSSASHHYAPIKLTGAAGTNLSAPTTGPLAGILFFQDRSITDHASTSTLDTSVGTYVGALYFPTTSLKFSGSSVIGTSTILVAWQLEFNGNTTLNANGLSDTGSPIKSPVLVE